MPRKSQSLNLIPSGNVRRVTNPSGKNQWSGKRQMANKPNLNASTGTTYNTSNNDTDTAIFTWYGNRFEFYPDGSYRIFPNNPNK